MKILCFTDNHFCENASLVRRMGTKYSMRIENQLASLNWVEELALKEKCEKVICLGDFFDKPDLTDQELTAIGDINWNGLPHYFIVGNHESTYNDLEFNSAKALESPNNIIISEPISMMFGTCEICFLPYVVEAARKPLEEYFGKKTDIKRIIMSHNDLNGLQMGPAISKQGIVMDEIPECCDLFLNGHLHNGQKVKKGIINLGNLTGKDFGENAAKYPHKVAILDTDNLSIRYIENPHAFNFYKFEINTEDDLSLFDDLKPNAILTVKCDEKLVDSIREKLTKLSSCGAVVEYRLIITRNISEPGEAELDIKDLAIDHLASFATCCKEKYGNIPYLDEELSEICK